MDEQRQRLEAAEQDAIAFLLRVDAPDAAEVDWVELGQWLKAAPEHRQAFDKVQRLCAELTDAAPTLVRELKGRQPAPAPRRRLEPRRSQPRVAWRTGAGLAAAAAAALVVFVVVRPPAPAPTEIYQTAKGEDRLVTLADGSSVHLNRASRISVRFEPKGRFVELTEGQAAFEVSADAARPFQVAAGDRTIRVVGTEFDVLREDRRVRVTVREGVVAVQSPEASSAAEPILLRAGDQLDHNASVRVTTIRKTDPEAAFAWRRGDLVYRDRPLDEVVAELNRYMETPVRVDGPAARLRFSGVLRIDSEEAMVRRLEGFLPVEAERRDGAVTLRLRSQG